MNNARRRNRRFIDEVRTYLARGEQWLLAGRLPGWLRDGAPLLQPLPPLQLVRISAESESDVGGPRNRFS